MMKKTVLAIGMLVLGTGLAQPLLAQSLEQRVQSLERLVSSQGLVEMLQRMERQQQEIQQLRGLLEEKEHAIETLRSRQRELYLDIDRRLSRLEREGLAGGGAPVASTESSPAPHTSNAGAVMVTGPGATASSASPQDEARLEQERVAYQKAFELLRELRYDQATAAFREFLQVHPDGRYAHIAQYWLGEASYAQRQFEQAIKDYQGLIERFPQSPKRAEAMLKIGYSWNELKQPEKAKPVLEQLLREFPNSTEAGQARQLLGKN